MFRNMSEDAWRRFVAWVAIVGLSCIGWWMAREDRRRPRPSETPAESPAQVRERITAGLPIQRQRIDDYQSRVGDETLSELELGLLKHEDLLVRIGSRSNDASPEMEFPTCLADRRLARLHEQAVKSQSGAAMSHRLFEHYFNLLFKDLHLGIDEWAAGTPRKKLGLRHDDCAHALSAAIFLSMEHERPAMVLAKIDQWQSAGDQLRDRIESIKWQNIEPKDDMLRRYILKKGDQVASSIWFGKRRIAHPEPLFCLNVYVRLLEKHRPGLPLAEVVPSGFLQFAPPVKVPFIAWNGHTNPYDFTHQSGGVAVDKERSLGEYTVFENWSNATGEDLRVHILRTVRQRLDAELGLSPK